MLTPVRRRAQVLSGPDEYLERCQGTPAFLAPEMMRPHSRYRCGPGRWRSRTRFTRFK